LVQRKKIEKKIKFIWFVDKCTKYNEFGDEFWDELFEKNTTIIVLEGHEIEGKLSTNCIV